MAGKVMGHRCDAAVSEVVATVLLVGLSVAFFGLVGTQLMGLPAPADTLHVDLRATLDRQERILLAHLGGEPLHLGSLEVRFDGASCALVLGPQTPDGPREDGDGVLETGERIATDCAATDGGPLVVVGGEGPRRGLLLQVTLPAVGSASFALGG